MRCLAVLFALLAFAAPAAAVDVDLQLVLAVDVSRSMDTDEQQLQRDGYVAAFRHQSVIDAITSGPVGRIAVMYLEWAGPGYQTVLSPWTVIAGPRDANAFADLLAEAPLSRETGTSISSGLTLAADQFAAGGFRSERRAIDVSGDGPNNAGSPVDHARDSVVGRGITINGLPILLKTDAGYGTFNIPDLAKYYEDCVIGGPGSFMVSVRDASQFEAAIRRKLILEIAGLEPRIIPAAEVVADPPMDCMIGEKLRWNSPYYRPYLNGR